jgi:hypothetical protein
MDEDSILAGRDDGEEVGVQCMLKGLWKVEGRYWVVEGECPVSLSPWSGPLPGQFSTRRGGEEHGSELMTRYAGWAFLEVMDH